MGSTHPEPRLHTILGQAVVLGKRGEPTALPALLEELSRRGVERSVIAHLWLVSGEPWRALMPTEGFAEDEQDVSAVFLRAISASLLGDRDGALKAREGMVALAEKASPARAIKLFLLAGFLAEEAKEAKEAWARFPEVAERRNDFSDRVRAARALLSSGETAAFIEEAKSLARRDDAPAEHLFRFGQNCERADAYELAIEIYERVLAISSKEELRTRARMALARLRIWKLSLDEAKAHLSHGASGHENEAARLRAILELFEGRPRRALSMLDALEKQWPELCRDAESWLIRAEAALELGELDAARIYADRASQIENSFIADVLSSRIRLANEEARRALVDTAPAEKSKRLLSSYLQKLEPRIAQIERLARAAKVSGRFVALLRKIVPAPVPEASDDDRFAGMGIDALDDVRASLGGNRSSAPTRRIVEGDGSARLVPWQLPEGEREAASNLLHRLYFEPPEEILRQFELLGEKFPSSPFPFTYQGELRLWLGDYAGASANFEEALNRQPTRWAFVGLAALWMLRGDEPQASRLIAESIAHFGDLPTATTYVYRGELRRRKGDLEGALRDLELALAERPHRVAARMNLALAYAALGRESEANRELRRAASDLPGIFVLAADALSRPLPIHLDIESARPFIERAFELMQGNRSSWMHTAFDKEGRFRVLPLSHRWIELARRELSMLETSHGLLRPAIKGTAKADHAD